MIKVKLVEEKLKKIINTILSKLEFFLDNYSLIDRKLNSFLAKQNSFLYDHNSYILNVFIRNIRCKRRSCSQIFEFVI